MKGENLGEKSLNEVALDIDFDFDFFIWLCGY